MKKLILFIYLVLIATMAVATFVESIHGTSFVTRYIYHGTPFVMTWAILAILTMIVLFYLQMRRRLFNLLLHLSFIIILLGAAISFGTSRKGFLYLRTGASSFQFVEQESRLVLDMPFILRLDSFWVETYPGTEAPSDYVSKVTCLSKEGVKEHSVEISMNRIFIYKGYRFYQSSYDEDGHGSWLSVNYDPWGTNITYMGYILLTLSMLGILFSRRSIFWHLLHHPALKRGLMVVLMAIAGVSTSQASSRQFPVISETEADSLAVLQVVYHNRVVPFNTLAMDFVKKLSGSERFDGLTPEQIVGSWMKYSDEWKDFPIIKIRNGELCRLMGLENSSYVCLSDLMDGGHYRLKDLWRPENQPINKHSALEKAILETDEKVALISMLLQDSLVKPIPTDGSVESLSNFQIKAELLYNQIPFNKILFMFNLSLGIFSFGWMLYHALKKNTSQARRKESKGYHILSFSLLSALLFHAFGYVLRWYIGGRIPLSNGYETMQFMALSILALAFFLRKRFVFFVPFGFLFSGFVLLVAYLGQMNPQITPLMPVLLSPWLSIHVSFIMVSYAFLAFIGFNGILGLCLPREAARLMLFSRLLLYPAVFFLGVGIFIGAVWANFSWGRYWAWDPKEVWALITFMVYGLAFHCDSLSFLSRPNFFHVYMILSFTTVLMTYFGVNYLFGGMHSYA